MRRPVWTTPPWTRAPLLLRRQPAVAVAVLITSALLGLACAALPLYLASAASAAVSIQTTGVCPAESGNDVEGDGTLRDAAATTNQLEARSVATLRHAGAAASDLTPPTETLDQDQLAIVHPGVPSVPVQLASRTDGLDHVAVLSSAGGRGVWLSDDVARTLGVRAGQTISLRGGTVTTPVRIAAIYRNLVGTVLPRFWCTEQGIFGTPDENAPPPPVVLTDQATFVTLLGDLHQKQLDAYHFERYLVGHRTLDQVRRIDRAADAFGAGLGDDEAIPPSGRRIGPGFRGLANPPTQLDAVAGHASAVRASLRGSIGPVSLAGDIVAVLLVGLSGSYWVDRRRIELRLLGVRGVGAAALGVKAMLETALPVAFGVVAGWGLALLIVPLLGPSSLLTAQAQSSGLELAAVGAAVGLALVGLVAGLRTRGLLERPVGRKTSRWVLIPFELLGLAGAIVVWRSLGQVSLEAAGNSAPKVPSDFLVFPLLLMLSLAILSGRLIAVLLSTGGPSRWTTAAKPAVWLAVRRLAGGPQLVAVLLLSTTASIGVLVYAAALTRSQQTTLHAKAEVFVGSDVSAQIDGPVRIPPALQNVSTIVDISDAGQVGENAVHIIAVNPATFRKGAFWNSSFASSSLSTLLHRLAAARPFDHELPVLTVGNLPSGGLSFVEYPAYGSASLDVVASARTFPGQNGAEPILVTTQADLKVLPVVKQPELWTHGDEDTVLTELNRVGDVVPIVISTHDVVGITEFAAIAWTFAYLQSLGILVGIVTVGGLLLFLTTRARARGLAYVLSRRMGLRRVVHVFSLAAELGVVLGLGGVVGGAIGWLAVEMAGRHLNPLPDLLPTTLIVVPTAALLLSLAALAATWLLSIIWAQRAADRTRPAELLRLDA